MKYLILLMMMGCGVSKTKMNGIVMTQDVYFDGMVPVEVTNAPGGHTWVKLSKRQLRHIKAGDRITFYVKAKSVKHVRR